MQKVVKKNLFFLIQVYLFKFRYEKNKASVCAACIFQARVISCAWGTGRKTAFCRNGSSNVRQRASPPHSWSSNVCSSPLMALQKINVELYVRKYSTTNYIQVQHYNEPIRTMHSTPRRHAPCIWLKYQWVHSYEHPNPSS